MATPSFHRGVICIPLQPMVTHISMYYCYLLSQISQTRVRGKSRQSRHREERSAPGVVTSPWRCRFTAQAVWAPFVDWTPTFPPCSSSISLSNVLIYFLSSSSCWSSLGLEARAWGGLVAAGRDGAAVKSQCDEPVVGGTRKEAVPGHHDCFQPGKCWGNLWHWRRAGEVSFVYFAHLSRAVVHTLTQTACMSDPPRVSLISFD